MGLWGGNLFRGSWRQNQQTDWGKNSNSNNHCMLSQNAYTCVCAFPERVFIYYNGPRPEKSWLLHTNNKYIPAVWSAPLLLANLQNISILTGICNWAGWLKHYIHSVNPKDRFFSLEQLLRSNFFQFLYLLGDLNRTSLSFMLIISLLNTDQFWPSEKYRSRSGS